MKLQDVKYDSLDEIAEGIRSMEIRGAGKIGRYASLGLSFLARDYRGKSREDFVKELKEGAKKLLSTRPSAISLKNSILLTLKGVEEGENVDEMREILLKRSGEFVRRSHEAVEKIAVMGMRRIPRGSKVLTHCNSNAALTLIERAFENGRVDEVYFTEYRPRRQGHITARRLAAGSIPVTMIVDSAVRYFIRDMDVVVVGADTVAANGAVINKIGTSQIALAAHEGRTPFIVASETLKFSRETLLGSLVEIEERDEGEVADPLKPSDFPGVNFRNPVFDATPPEYIDAIVTEVGVVSPYLATEVIRDMFGISGPVSTEGKKDETNWL
jgi:ribose 1,5-bisphosphate isomerase